MTMRPQLDDLRVRVGHTDKTLLQLTIRGREIIESGSAYTRLMSNPDNGKLQATVGGSTDVPRDIAVDVGLCLHNMRATLDGLAYQLAWLNKGDRLTEDEGKKTEFPIYESKALFDRKKHSDYLTPYIPRLEKYQPYLSQSDEPDPLLILHKLNNIDKHRLLLVVGARVQPITTDPQWTHKLTHDLESSHYKRIDNLGAHAIEGEVIGEFDAAPKPFMANARFAIQLCFGDDHDLVNGQEVVPTLKALSSRVAKIVEDFAVDFACA